MFYATLVLVMSFRETFYTKTFVWVTIFHPKCTECVDSPFPVTRRQFHHVYVQKAAPAPKKGPHTPRPTCGVHIAILGALSGAQLYGNPKTRQYP